MATDLPTEPPRIPSPDRQVPFVGLEAEPDVIVDARTPPPLRPPAVRQETLPAPVRTSPTLEPPAEVTSENRMLPPHRNKLERITDHVAAVSEDLREWTELRIALVKRQVEGLVGIVERIQHLAEAAKLAVPGVILLILGALFLLVTIALFLGQLLGSYGLGFLIVTLVLMIGGGVLVWLAKKRYDTIQAEVAEAKRNQRNAASASREELADAQRRRVQQSAA